MKVVMVDIEKINDADYNPRTIDNKGKAGLKQSIETFGLQQPLIVNKRTGNLVSGHQRKAAAQELGLKKVPVVYVDLSEIEEKAFNITMNNKAIEGDFTEEVNSIIDEIRLELGNDFIFDLNLEDVLSQLSESEGDDFEADLPDEDKPEKEPTYKIVIICKDDLEQQELFDELKSRGFKVSAS
jgi:hypothetical protein